MLTVDEAVATLLQSVRDVPGSENVGLAEASGRTLAEPLVAAIDVPPTANSAMDGYALRHADWMPGTARLPISQRITAGSVPAPLEPGTVARIFTGATVPPGADTVVMQEQCEGTPTSVQIPDMPQPGANIRPRGQDIPRGREVLPAGLRLKPQDLGLAASLGVASLQVRRRLHVAILSTGDELVEPGEIAGPGKIYNSNRYTLQAQLTSWGIESIDLGVVRDNRAAVRERLAHAASSADVVVTTGGVSVGEEDHVRSAVDELGSLSLWRIAVKPGKPFAFGEVMGKPFIGLPGNPVSTLVTLLVVARPFLLASQGVADTGLHGIRLPSRFEKLGGTREEYPRARLAEGGVELYSNQSSGVLSSATWADGLVRLRIGQDVRPGDPVEFLPFSQFN